MKNVATMKTKELVEAYNAVSGKPPITAWKKKVAELHAFLLKAQPDVFYVETIPDPSADRMADFEAPQSELAAQTVRPVDETDETKVKPKPKTAKKVKASPVKRSGDIERGAIRAECERLLLVSRGTDKDTNRPLGLPYAAILEKVAAKFPKAETSLNCLRWYATKMNKRTGTEKVVMPVRPTKTVAA